MFDWLLNAIGAGVGAFAGGMGAYLLACRQEDVRRKAEYLCLLLLVYENLELLNKGLTDFVDADIFESDGTKYVRFDAPLPNLAISSEQMQTLFAVAPDRQMPSTLIHVQNFVASHRQRVIKYGSDPLPLDFVKRQIKQLQFMLLSVRTQYEQAAKDAFPLD